MVRVAVKGSGLPLLHAEAELGGNHHTIANRGQCFPDKFSVLVLGKGSPREEGLPSLAEMMPEEKVVLKTKHGQKAPENMSAFQIFCTYVLRNKNAWYVSFVDVFVYMVRFGMISWLPIYLLTVKHFSKEQMSVAFLFFEWAAIPSTLLAGWLSDKLFKGRRMPLAIICMTLTASGAL